MEKDRAIELLKQSGALLDGHFCLTSGNHSARYIQCALLLSRPELATDFMQDIAYHFRSAGIDTIAAPAVGGIIAAYEIARLLGKRSIFLEREKGVMSLRRGFGIEQGERLLIVEDVITTGGSVLEVAEVLRREGGEVGAFACIVNRSEGRFQPDVPFYFCVNMNVPIYAPGECPLCASGIPVVKPGSRGLKGET